MNNWPEGIVVICVKCAEDDTIVLDYEPEKGFNLPWKPVLSEGSYHEAITSLLNDHFGDKHEARAELKRCIRIWRSNMPALTTMVFDVYVNKLFKNSNKTFRLKKPSIPASRWIAMSSLPSLANENKASIELSMLCSSDGNGFESFYGQFSYSSPSLIDVSKSHLMNFSNDVSDNMQVVKNLVYCINQLALASNLGEKDIGILVNEFVAISAPHVFMSYLRFEDFFSQHISMPSSIDLYDLFRAIDYKAVGSVSFKQLFPLLVALDSKTVFKGPALDGRNLLIFRYFDKNNDGKLNVQEFTQLLKSIKGGQPEMESIYREMDVKPFSDVPVNQFLRAVNSSKLQGINSILRASTNLENVVKKMAQTYGGRLKSYPKPGDANGATPNCGLKGRRKTTIKIALHSVKLGQLGMESVQPVSELERGSSDVDLFSQRGFLVKRASSELLFNPRNDVNEILLGLRYFAETAGIRIYDERTKRTLLKPKLAFTWGQIQLKGFARNILSVCREVMGVFQREPRMVQINSPVYILGDFHGNYRDLYFIEQCLWGVDITLSSGNILLLGDYVDRGAHCVEVIAYLFSIKIKAPSRVTLLRGNHEIREVQKLFTFQTECIDKFGKQAGIEVWEAINRAFDYMPLAAVVDGALFCCHGGIPAPWLCPSIEAINKIPCPLTNPIKDSALAWDLMWNDPIRSGMINEAMKEELDSKEGFISNLRRGTAHMFNEKALDSFLMANNLSFLIRAHEMVPLGFFLHHSGKCITVFSSSSYDGGDNLSACLLVQSEKIRILRFDPAANMSI